MKHARGFADLDAALDPGKVYTIIYPFIRDTYQDLGADGFQDVPTWRPGIRYEDIGPEDVGAVADAIGSCSFTVEGHYKPGRFPTRVFYTRQYQNPDGKPFGKGKLHISTVNKFYRLTRGFQHAFGIGEPLEPKGRFGDPSWEDFEAMLSAEVARINGPASPHPILRIGAGR